MLTRFDHLVRYGCPLHADLILCGGCHSLHIRWKAHFPEVQYNNMVKMASWKLTNGVAFNDQVKDHVFAMLSQQLQYALNPSLLVQKLLHLQIAVLPTT